MLNFAKKPSPLCKIAMRNYNLGFISDKDIYNHVKETIESYRREITLDQFNKNIVDPIKLTFDSKVYGKSILLSNYKKPDKSNGLEKIKSLHKKIFHSAGYGWETNQNDFDVENKNLHIYAEIIDSSQSVSPNYARKSFIKMQTKLLEDKQAFCYLVELDTDRSFDICWKIIENDNIFQHNQIHKISIDNFYRLIFGDKMSYQTLSVKLPIIIDDVIKELTVLS